MGVECAGRRRNLLWLSLQNDRAISIGFVDQACIVRGFTSQRECGDGTIEREYVDLEGQHGLDAVTDPHFTLHGDAYFHLRGNKKPFLLQGLVWTDPGPGQDFSPWLKFISNPVRTLTPFEGVPPGKQGYNIRIASPRDDLSVRVHFDFVRAAGAGSIDERGLSHYIEWQGVVLHCSAYVVPGQPASLGYRILG
jgi:hypothetical protein